MKDLYFMKRRGSMVCGIVGFMKGRDTNRAVERLNRVLA